MAEEEETGKCVCGYEFPDIRNIVSEFIHIIGKCPNCGMALWGKDNKPINRFNGEGK